MTVSPWAIELPWLCEFDNRTTAADVEQMKKYFEDNPRQLKKKKDSYGYLPLHNAAYNQRGEHGEEAVRALLTAYPLATQRTSKYGSLPLHCAATFQTGEHGVEIVKMLLTAYPLATQQETISGYLPLHLAAESQQEEHGVEIVTMLLTAYPLAAQHKANDGCLPLDIAQRYNSDEHALVALLEQAAQGQWQSAGSALPAACTLFSPFSKNAAHNLAPIQQLVSFHFPQQGDVPASKLALAYHFLDPDADVVDTATPAHTLTVEQVEVLSRRARLLAEHSSSADALQGLAAAASILASEDRLSRSAATLLQAGPLLREVIAAVHAPHRPLPPIAHLQGLSTTAEEAASRLRACHGALTAHVSSQPPPKAVDVALVAARNAALAAVQTSSSALDKALLESDLATVATASEDAAQELDALLRRVMVTTGIEPEPQADGDDLTSTDCPGSAAAAKPSDSLGAAVAQLAIFACDTVKAIERLAALAPVTLASLGEKDTGATRTALATMQEITHSLLLATSDGSLQHYVAFEAPWKLACSALAARCAVLKKKAEAVSGLVATARHLQQDTAAWTAAFAEREVKVEVFKRTHRTLSEARRSFLRAKLDAETEDDSGASSDEDDNVSTTAAARGSEGEPPAKRACRRAFVERDSAANDLYAFALAYCPEVLVQQRKRLMPGGLPTVVSQRSRSDYDNVGPLERAGEGRHTLLSASFEGVRCVLKMVPLSRGSALAREADILKRVQHPNIVELLSIFVENDVAYLHMAHASHGDLEHFLTLEAAAAVAVVSEPARATPAGAAILPPYQLQRMGRQLCEAVAYLAERSIVHCDIKPANVFVDGERSNDSLRVVLGDFDVSHTATGRTTTLTRAVSGVATHYTPGYAPPEVLFAAAGQPPRVSPAIDVYGLGCVLFAMHMHPRKLPEPASVGQTVASNSALFSLEAVAGVATPVVPTWAASVPREVVQAATCADPRARSSARELLHTRYMLDASGSFAHVAIQRPAYWLHQTHTGSWLEEEPVEVRVAVERALNATADPSTHGVGRDSHGERFQRFKVTRVRRLEHPVVWAAYAAQRRHLADTLLSEGYAAPSGIEAVTTDGCFTYPLEGGSLDTAAREVFLFHGSSRPASIANSGFDVRYAFAGAGAGAMFGSGLYFAESASKADQYVGRDGTRSLTMVVARVLLGRTAQVSAPRRNWPFLPEVAEKSSVEVPVYYDSIVADLRPQGMRFREVVVGEGSRAYPELFVEYERV